MDSKQVFGIDLGTTYSCISVVDDTSGKPSVLVNADEELTTPSVVFFEDADTRIVGKEAKNIAVLETDRVVEMVKRNMGSEGWRWAYGGKEYSPEEISSYILTKIVDDAEMNLGERPRDVVITCPAYFGIPQREATAVAGEIAGLNVLEVINEPTAAAISYGLQDNEDQVVLVYDLGGGTFDVSIIEIKDGSVTVLATGGDHELGGRDWDEELVKYASERWMTITGSYDNPLDNAETLQDLWSRAEDAKRSLTSRAETRIQVSHAAEQRVAVVVTREKFDELTAHLLENTISLTRDTIEAAREKLRGTRVDKFLLVGGSTRMPQVAERLRREFGTEPQMHEPDQSVAKGAAIYGQKLAIGRRINIEIARELGTDPDEVAAAEVEPEVRQRAQQSVADEMGMRLPALKKLADMKVTNVVSHSFGVIALKGPESARTEFISNLILAQDQLPASKTRTFYTEEGGQADVQIRITESAARVEEIDDLDEGTEVGEAVLPMTEDLPAGAPVEVTFKLDQQGRLHVTGKDLADGGKTVTATVETNRALSAEEAAAAKTRVRGIKITG